MRSIHMNNLSCIYVHIFTLFFTEILLLFKDTLGILSNVFTKKGW